MVDLAECVRVAGAGGLEAGSFLVHPNNEAQGVRGEGDAHQ